MPARQILLYFAWSRPSEASAPLLSIDDRFPAIFELRRLFYPSYEHLSNPAQIDQGISGFLDHVQKPNFAAFAEQASSQSGRSVISLERVDEEGKLARLESETLSGVDTIVVISFDSNRSEQVASPSEIDAIGRFLADPDHMIFVCPHHDIGSEIAGIEQMRVERKILEHRHHGDAGIPPQQGFGGFARSLLAGLGVPIQNRFGLRPATAPDGSPAPIIANRELDECGLLSGVETLNIHPHLPHLERLGGASSKMEVLVRQKIDPSAPPHPFTEKGRFEFDALLQSRPDAFAGKLLVCDTTLFSSAAGGLSSLRNLWSNLISRPKRIYPN